MADPQDEISQYMTYLRGAAKGASEADLQGYEKYLRGQPGNSPENPASVDMLSDLDRLKASFGDKDNLAFQGYKAGYQKPHVDAEGHLLAQDKSGHYVKDATNFFPNQLPQTKIMDLSSAADAAAQLLKSAHPINWTEANLGYLLPGAGWLAGGAGAGAGAGVLTENPAAAAVAASAGAGTGAGAGEVAREAIGRELGTYHAPFLSEQSDQDVGNQMIRGGVGELGGRVIGAVPLPKAMGGDVQGAISKVASKALAAPSWLAMGGPLSPIPFSDIARVAERPQGVSAAGKSGFGLRTAEQGEKELSQTMRDATVASRQASDQFRSTFGDQQPNKSAVVAQTLDWLERHGPNELGDSRVTPEEYDEILRELGLIESGNADTMLTQAQRLNENMPASAMTKPAGQASNTMLSQRKAMAKGIKDSLHTLDPEGLALADATFSAKKDMAKTLSPIQGETQEGVVNNLWGKNATARQEAAEALTPKTYSGPLLDLRARQAFEREGMLGADNWQKGARLGVGGLLGSALATHYGYSALTPEGEAAMAAVIAAMSPKVNYLMLQGAGRATQKALPGLLYGETPSNPWSLMPQKKETP